MTAEGPSFEGTAIAEQLLQRYPDEEEAYDLITHTLTYTRDPERSKEALAFMQQWARAIPGPGSGHFHNHYGYVLIENGLYAEAEKEFRAYIRVSPGEANPYDSLAELFLMTSRPRDAVELYNQALRRNPLFGASYWGRAYAQAMLGDYGEALASVSTLEELGTRSGWALAIVHMECAFIKSRAGRYREADAHLASARRVARELQDTASEADAMLLEAMIALERGQRARVHAVVREADRVTATQPADLMWKRRAAFAHLLRGTADARAGRTAEARAAQRALVALGHDNDDVRMAWEKLLGGEIALADGAFDEAEAAFRTGEYRVPPSFSIYPILVALNNNHPFRDGVARAQAARGAVPEAIAFYRRLNEPDIASPWTDVVDPRVVLAGARLAARAGDRQTAVAEYTRFRELWTAADAGLPELTEATR